MKRVVSLIVFVLILAQFSVAQSSRGKISGKISSEGEPVTGITVYLEGTQIGDVTNFEGEYELKNIPPGEYIFVVSGLGYTMISEKIFVDNGVDIFIDKEIEVSIEELEEVFVFGKSEATEIRELAYAIEVVEAESFKNLSSNGNDILARVSGINIRESGGVGSESTLSLNGLSGNQVRIFLDGVPMDYFGSSLSLNNFSANLIERIEVYKGVVPIHLSSDALGGAINVITSNKLSSFADISYSRGSFGTDIASINAQHRTPSGFTTKLKAFYNYSDNNYKVPIYLINGETGKEDDEATYVERFHDAYESRMVWVETGITGVSFADQLMVGLMVSDNFDEIQQPANATGEAKIPFGEVFADEKKVITNFAYSKKGLFDNKLSLNSYFVAAFLEDRSVDTSSYDYDWLGGSEIRIDSDTGEADNNRKTLLELSTDNYLGNFNAEYAFNNIHNVAANYSLNYLTLVGSDNYRAQNNTQFGQPSDVNKQVMGLSYSNSILQNRLKTTVFGKYYSYIVTAIETDYNGIEVTPFRNDKSYYGFGVSSTYQFEKLQLKASYENAIRFPEIIELFGDGLNSLANPRLLPESSRNYNLGFIYSTYSASKSLIVSVNGFVRDTKDYILPQVVGIVVTYQNYGKTLAQGIDVASTVYLNNRWSFNLNGTYLDKRDNNKPENGQSNTSYEIRIPNEPYLFGNFSASFLGKGLFNESDSYSISLSENYVHSFYYRWENLASQDKGVVPEQWTTDMEFVYSFADQRYNVSAVVSNLWDSDVYDNYLQLRPGRTFSIKFRYLIN